MTHHSYSVKCSAPQGVASKTQTLYEEELQFEPNQHHSNSHRPNDS